MRSHRGLALLLAWPLAAQLPPEAELRLKVGSVHLQNDIYLNGWLAATDLRTLSLDYVSPGIRGEAVRLSWSAGLSGVVSGDRNRFSPPFRSWDKTAYLQHQVHFTFQPRAQVGAEVAFGRTLIGGFRSEIRYGRFGTDSNRMGHTSATGLYQGLFAGWQDRTWRTSLQGGYFLAPGDSMAPAREIALTVGRTF